MLLSYKEFLKNAKIILGSQSKGRQGLLKMVDLFKFEVFPSTFEENLDKQIDPLTYVQKTCEGKVINLLETFKQNNQQWDICIFADTVCEINGKIIEKPNTKEDAYNFLKLFSNSLHLVHTCVYVVGKNEKNQIFQLNGVETTEVHFQCLPEKSIQIYVEDESNWKGRAGGYAIQALGNMFIKKINGDYSNVIGLPLPVLDKLMSEIIELLLKKD
ncbi:unnamed protein product [Paramecium octaurelia]|uniref:Uncharacterized protein n=1 Tax=Paramecium octaurelia TaxID=43137 RepID=A0A8S1TNW6_PAROT|nr:unnamed protein product [Paramecium octaurelia]